MHSSNGRTPAPLDHLTLEHFYICFALKANWDLDHQSDPPQELHAHLLLQQDQMLSKVAPSQYHDSHAGLYR